MTINLLSEITHVIKILWPHNEDIIINTVMKQKKKKKKVNSNLKTTNPLMKRDLL